MNKTQRIVVNGDNIGNDKYIKVRLEQSIDTLEFMSMSLDNKDIYQNFNSDYGVLIGRVLANGNVGVPNAKISIFIPLSDADAVDGEISSIYPYTTPRDQNNEGKRYNLLPRVAKYNTDGQIKPAQPFGSFPIKEEIVTNISFLNVYKKYYKYTATTNDSGDYMIFGVPIGVQTVHMSVDITDIGKYSMNPASMITLLGYSENLFTEDKTKIKSSNNLEDLPHIETQEVSVDIIPFWGDENNFEIGITRQDFRIRSILTNSFIVFGSAFTDGDKSMWGDNIYGAARIRELYCISGNKNTTEPYSHMGMESKRIGNITEKIYYYPSSIANPDDVNVTQSDMKVLYNTEYSTYKSDGVFVYIIPCNRDKVITDEFGNEVAVPADYPGGVFTSFKGFMTFENNEDDIKMDWETYFPQFVSIAYTGKLKPIRYKLKVPQYNFTLGHTLRHDDENIGTKEWKKQYFTFKSNTVYSISRFHGLVYTLDKYDDSIDDAYDQNGTGFSSKQDINQCVVGYESSPNDGIPLLDQLDKTRCIWFNSGIIKTDDVTFSADDFVINSTFGMPHNSDNINGKYFGANWLNFSLYFPQFAYCFKGYSPIHDHKIATNFCADVKDQFLMEDNDQEIAANELNTKWFARSDLHFTDFIEVPFSDIQYFANKTEKGFMIPSGDTSIKGDYRCGLSMKNSVYFCPINGGYKNGDHNTAIRDNNIYFYKGYNSDCFDILKKINLVNR